MNWESHSQMELGVSQKEVRLSLPQTFVLPKHSLVGGLEQPRGPSLPEGSAGQAKRGQV